MTPKYDAAASGIYTVPLSFGSLHCARRCLAQRARVQRHQRLQPPGLVGLLNARAALTSAGAALQATLFGTNLTDKRYAYTGGTIVNPGTIPVASWQAAADRRLYGVEVAYRFSTPR